MDPVLIKECDMGCVGRFQHRLIRTILCRLSLKFRHFQSFLEGSSSVHADEGGGNKGAYPPGETSRACERRIQHLGAIGGSQEQHPCAPLEAIQLCEQLIQSLVSLFVESKATLTTCATDFIKHASSEIIK